MLIYISLYSYDLKSARIPQITSLLLQFLTSVYFVSSVLLTAFWLSIYLLCTHFVAPANPRARPKITWMVGYTSSKNMKPAYVRNTSLMIPVMFRASGPPTETVIAIEKEKMAERELNMKTMI